MRSRSAIASAAIAVAMLAGSFVQISSAAASGGTLLWVAQTKVGPYGWAEGMGISPDGSRAYVTGTRQKVGHSYDFVTVAYDTSTGAEIWATRFDNAMHTQDSAWAIKVSPDGSRVFVIGQSRTGGRGIGGFDDTTVAYDAATGAQLWVASYDGPSRRDDRPVALDVSPDGSSVFVTGRSNGLGTRSDYATVAYDAATGAHLWVARWGAAGVAYDDAWAVAVSPDASRVIVTGSSIRYGVPRSQYRAVTIAYSATTGAELWLRRSSRGEAGSAGFSLTISPDGSRVYVTGGRFGGASDSLSTIAYDMGDGAEEWAARYDRDGPWPMFTNVAPDGSRVYVSSQNATTALDGSSGGKVWADPTALGIAGMALPRDGSHVYVGGYIGGAMETIAYDPTSGAKEWTSTYGTPGGGLVARSIATTPDGSKVLVSGYGVVDGNADFVTIAYSTA